MKSKGSFLLFILFLCALSESIAQNSLITHLSFDEVAIPPPPDYSVPSNWAALPEVADMADLLPKKSKLIDNQENAKADVFFVHPTIFIGTPKNEYFWNADIGDKNLNQKTDELPILNQCTAFNGSCKVYAPRYRQAHYRVFKSVEKTDAVKALAIAYEDVKSAFEYYLENFNEGRPIVLASHSQGTVHTQELIKDFFDGKPLQNLLVEAYLIGMPVKENVFKNIKASNDPEHFGGFVTWNTFQQGYFPSYYHEGLHEAICTNPLTWKTDNTYADRKMNLGGVGLKFKFIKKPVDAQVNDGMLWINKPHIPGRIFIKTKTWHKADINLYWMNIRENVALRLANYLNQ